MTTNPSDAVTHVPRLLHIEASPRGKTSFSSTAASDFIAGIVSQCSSVTIDHLNLWSHKLPEFTGNALSAKYARLSGNAHNPDQAYAWAGIVEDVKRLAAADAILISTPMWNLGIPYRLKHYIDIVTQPGLSFSFDPAHGYSPLLASVPVIVLLASAGDFREGSSYGRTDLATPYLKAALGFIGFNDVSVIPVAPTGGPAANIAAGRAQAQSDIGYAVVRLIEAWR